MSREHSEAARIKLLNVNIELEQQSRLPANERAMNNKTEEVRGEAANNLASDKDKLLAQALEDKRKLLQLLSKVKQSFEGFKKRHADISSDVAQGKVEAAGESGATDRSIENPTAAAANQF